MKERSIIFFIIALLTSSYAVGRTIRVGSSELLTSIRKGIAVALPNDTLEIQSGTYREGNIIIEKPLIIIGNNYPVLDGEFKHEILTIRSNDVVVSGLRFINSGMSSINDPSGVKVLQAKRVKIINNKFETTFFGIHVDNSTDCLIEGNELKSDATDEQEIGNGIHLWKCGSIKISNNKVHGHRDGIYLEFVTQSFITNNISDSNKRYGLHFMFSHNNEYQGNTFINNGAGVAVMYTKGVRMLNNRFEHNWGSASYGLLLKDISDSYISGNVFLENSVGIFIEGSSRNEFNQNEFSKNGYAIKLQANCDDNTIVRNNFRQNTFDLVTNGTLVLNKIQRNYWDRYEGYDLNRDLVGDVPYRPISMYGMIVERMPTAVLLWRSFLVFLLDRAEKAIPVITPENLRDDLPTMKPYDFNQ